MEGSYLRRDMGLITIYEKQEKQFNSLGLGVLSPVKCTITEEINGMYELELIHPFDINKYYERIQNERIILADTPTGKQPFRIYRIVPTLTEIKVNAKHIFYDLLDNFIESTTLSGKAGDVLHSLVNSFNVPTPFTFDTDLQTISSITINNENPVSALLNADEENPKFIQAFGGELMRDKFRVSILSEMGVNRNAFIRYGKNLIGVEVTEDYSDIVTKLYPIGKDGLTLPNKYVLSPNINAYNGPKIKAVEFNDAENIQQLQSLAEEYLNDNDKPKISIDIQFIDLRQTVEYAQFQFLEEVFLGDTVTILIKKLNLKKQAKVIKYVYNSLANSYDSITIGEFVPILTNLITKTSTQASNISNVTSAVDKIENQLNNKVKIINGELIVLDNTNISSAKVVYKFNDKGISKSTTGINGTFKNILN